MDAHDRAVGALLGLAVGDAVGTTLEFQTPGTFAPIDDMVGGGPFHLAPGQWTDDTAMALCLAESILDTGTMDVYDQLRRYLKWRDTGYLSSNGRCFDVGVSTNGQLERFRRTGEAVDPHPDQEEAANGSLMRLAGVPIRWHRDTALAATRAAVSSRSTHPARRPVDACRLMGAMVAALVDGAPFDEVTAPLFWRWGKLDPEIGAIATGAWAAMQPPAIRGTGYCVDALSAALWAVGGASNFRDAILRAVNLGEDADTTGAIAGQLAGARWGASGIPEAWRCKVAGAERITSLATALFVRGGGPAEHAWAHDQTVHAWWVEPGWLLAGEYPGHQDLSRARLKIDLLLDAGVRTFVDLTTGDDGLDPYQAILDQAADDRALVVERDGFPIPDLGVVADDRYDAILAAVQKGFERGVVYVHCWGGVGRTGTVVGCRLAEEGWGYEEVMVRLAELRFGTRKAARTAPETSVQRAVLRRRAEARSERR